MVTLVLERVLHPIISERLDCSRWEVRLLINQKWKPEVVNN